MAINDGLQALDVFSSSEAPLPEGHGADASPLQIKGWLS